MDRTEAFICETKAALSDNILPFWIERMKDPKGGYYGRMSGEGELDKDADFIMAKAQVALDYIAGMPVIADNGEMNLRKARHPLLEKALKREGKQIVPLTITLTPAKHILLISGPNAGGKSVCLKTTGLLQYTLMAFSCALYERAEHLASCLSFLLSL